MPSSKSAKVANSGDNLDPKSKPAPAPRSRGRSANKPAAPAPAAPAAAPAAPVPMPAPAAKLNTPSEESAAGRKASVPGQRKVHEQRAKVARRASALLKFVSDPTRLQILLILGDGEKHVGALCEHLSQSQPAVSHHLALLRHGGIIVPRRAGKNNFYSLSDSGRDLGRVAQILLDA